MKRAAVLLNVPETTLTTYASIHRISFHGPRAPGRWTEALLDKVRAYAAQGHTQRRTAELLSVPVSSLSRIASIHKIRFHGNTVSRGGRVAMEVVAILEARLARAREIAGAVREREAARGYKRGPLAW